jgi:hypothetical protein
VSTRLLRSLYTETRSLRLRLEELFGGLAPRVSVTVDEHAGVPSISFGAYRRSADDESKRQALEAVFQRLDSLRQRTGRPVAVVLDEFQAINALAGEAGEGSGSRSDAGGAPSGLAVEAAAPGNLPGIGERRAPQLPAGEPHRSGPYHNM